MLNLWIGIRPSEDGVLRGTITDAEGIIFWFTSRGVGPAAFSSISPSRMTRQRRRHAVCEWRYRARRQLAASLLPIQKATLDQPA